MSELEAVTGTVVQLLKASPEQPARLRVSLDGASVEMEWRVPDGARMPGAALTQAEPPPVSHDLPSQVATAFFACADLSSALGTV